MTCENCGDFRDAFVAVHVFKGVTALNKEPVFQPARWCLDCVRGTNETE